MVKTNGEKITIDKLAKLINNGFEGMSKQMTKQITESENRLTDKISGLEKDIKAVRQQIAGAIFRSEFDGLASRVEYLENVLDLPAKKH